MKLAVDLSTTATGWAVGDSKKPKAWGTIEPPARMPLPYRLQRVVDGLLAICDQYAVDEVHAEELHSLRGMPAVRALAGLRGAVIYALIKRDVPVYFRHQKQGYNALGLKGNAKKPEVVQRCKRLGYEVANDNEADALAVYIGSL